jgi:hypothetical protein
MVVNRSLAAAVAAAATVVAFAPATAVPLVRNDAAEVVGAGAAADPLIAVEAHRPAIVNRLVAEHGAALAALGVPADAFRAALGALRADQLLAASLVDSAEEVTAILADGPVSGAALQRYVALAPSATGAAGLPAAQAYAVRDSQGLRIVRAADLQPAQGQVIVGYFVAPARPVTMTTIVDNVVAKDGPGTGTNSWIGNTAGGNIATGTNSSVTSGSFNAATALNAFVGAGQANEARGTSSLVIGGFDNHATAIDSLVGAGAGNRATGARSVIMGGGYNLVSGQFSMLGGGGRGGTASTPAGTNQDDNVVSGDWSGLLAGKGNRVSGNYAFVGGGAYNLAYNNGSVVGGGNNGIPGQGNAAYGLNSFVGGGYSNHAGTAPPALLGAYTVVAGGNNNEATGDGAVVVGGHNCAVFAAPPCLPGGAASALNNSATGINSFVGTGYQNVASGDYAFIGAGHDNTASGAGSVALGIRAKTEASGGTVHDGAFVFSDGALAANFRSSGPNTFNVLATGGARIVTGATVASGELTAPTGVEIAAGGGSWTSLSDRAAKRDLHDANARDVRARVAAMPVYTWRYITEVSGALHMGPTAQDFRAACGLGDSDRRITAVDADGVALAAIKGLKQVIDEKDARIDALERELGAIKRRLGLE